MLTEILDTRVMVKNGLKRAKVYIEMFGFIVIIIIIIIDMSCRSIKKANGDKATARALDARQLGLKLLANVTYGYTSGLLFVYVMYHMKNNFIFVIFTFLFFSASFSGRMPCAPLADSIVQTARDTLERKHKIVILYRTREN
jgi:DNA polymerase elongation subunit (family B)